MPTNFIGWFQPPTFPDDEDKTRGALLLNVVLNTFLIALPIVVAGTLLGNRVPRLERIIAVITVAWLMILGIRILMLQGKVALTGKILVIIIYFTATLAIYNLGTIRAPATSFYLLTIVISGLVISRRAILWMAGINISTILLFLFAERNGLLPTPTLTISVTQGVTYAVALTIMSVLLYLAVKSIDEALERARQELQTRTQTEAALQQINSRLAILHEIDNALLSAHSLHDIAKAALVRIRKLIPCERASVTLFNFESHEASFLTADFDGMESIPHTPIKMEEYGLDVIERLAQNKAWFTSDMLAESEVTELDKRLVNEYKIRIWLSLPLFYQGQLIGALNLGRATGNPFQQQDAEIAHNIANQLAIALQQTYLYNALQNELDSHQRLISELEARNDELTRFTYTVSHDLRSPLVTIKGFIGMLRKDLRDARHDRVDGDFQRIARATDKMDELLSDLLELSRIGRIVNPPVDIDTVRLIQNAIDSVDARLRSKNVTVNVLPDLPGLYGDRIRLREVFENLIDNAAKYMGDQAAPLIEIGAKQEKGECIFYVKDNGMGIDPAYQTRIFSIFEKLNPTSEGSGIGLSLVKRIIETHGGRIWVESDGEGKGTAFYFMVPRNRDNEVKPGESKAG